MIDRRTTLPRWPAGCRRTAQAQAGPVKIGLILPMTGQ